MMQKYLVFATDSLKFQDQMRAEGTGAKLPICYSIIMPTKSDIALDLYLIP